MCPLLENAFNSILRKNVFRLIAKGRDTVVSSLNCVWFSLYMCSWQDKSAETAEMSSGIYRTAAVLFCLLVIVTVSAKKDKKRTDASHCAKLQMRYRKRCGGGKSAQSKILINYEHLLSLYWIHWVMIYTDCLENDDHFKLYVLLVQKWYNIIYNISSFH